MTAYQAVMLSVDTLIESPVDWPVKSSFDRPAARLVKSSDDQLVKSSVEWPVA